MGKTHKIGRSAKTGRYTTVKQAERYKTTHIVEKREPKKD